jgi:cytochrome c-type biogenesis protein CcmH/NrfG
MEPEAEQNCDQLLALALQIDPSNPEVLQCLASVRMSQQREADAKDLVLRAWSLWKDLPPGSSF